MTSSFDEHADGVRVLHQIRATFISIGCDIGGPEPCMIRDDKVLLYQALSAHLTSSHCPAIDEFALVLRVSGSIHRFGEEKITRIRFARKRRYVTADIQIPESVWKPMTRSQLRSYLVRQVKAAVAGCVSRLREEGCVVTDDKLQAEIEAGSNAYLVS